ncbi:hypothetical protein BJ912DRAFT_1061422 [Pholiota molesta]|nr:hypothetical protein BJ912DRAFT_1061422 [Pholiota molesta]
MPLHTTPQKHTPSASGSTLANEGGPPASLKIKIKPIQYRAVNVTTPTRIGSSMMSEPAGAFTAASPIAHPDIPTASDPQSGPHPSSKSRSPITTGFGTGSKFGFSPRFPPILAKGLYLQHLATRTPLAIVVRPQAGTSTPLDGRASIAPRTPTRTPRTHSLLAEPRKAKVEEVVYSQEANISPVTNLAERAVQGLLDAQAVTPQRPYSLDPGVAGPGPLTPNASASANPSASSSLVIRLPPSAFKDKNKDKNISQTPIRPSRSTLKEEEIDDEPAEQIAARAVKGLLHAQATSPQKPYSVNLDMTGSAQKSTVVLMDPPKAQLRHCVSRHLVTPMSMGAGLGSSKMDSRATKQEELDTTGFQADKDVVGQTLDDTVETENGQGEKSVSVEATPIQADQSMEDLTINESQPTNEDRAGHDDPMEDVTSKQVSMEVQISSDSQKALPSTPTAASPLPPLEVLEKSAEPDPEYGAEFTDSPPLLGDWARTDLSPQHDLQLSPILPATDCPPPVSPAIEMLELLTSENAPSISYTIRTTSTEPKDTIPPSLASTYVLSTDTAVALPISQTTTTTVDEQQVDSLLMDDIVSSSPVKHSAAEPDRQEPPNDLEPDLSFIQAQDTTPRCSPIIPSSCSPPELWPDGFEMDDVLDKSGAVTEHDSDKQQPPQHDENVIRTPSPVSPRIHSASPNVEPISAVDEDTLRPEVILQVKTELGALPDRLVTQKQTSSAGHGRSLTTEPEFIYISDSSPQKPPVKKTVVANQGQKKRIQRALSIISISSDDEDVDNRPKVNPPQSDTENGINKPSEIRVLKVERFGDPFHTNPSTIVATQPNPTPNEALPAASILTKELSPMSDLSNETPPPEHNAEKGLNNVGNSSFDFKKYSAKLDADDDVPIIPLKKRRKVSGISEAATEDGSVADSENGTVAVKKKSLLVLAKKGRSAAVTRVKKRKNLDQEVDSDEEEQPPPQKSEPAKRYQSK